MASSSDGTGSPLTTNWSLYFELLPGIEEFLTETLAHEHLSLAAEERRQFFLERLDIVKLPPSLPPREGRKLSPELLKETEETSGVPSLLSPPPPGGAASAAAAVCSDFAAAQRLIARSLAGHRADSSSAHASDGEDMLVPTGMKVYDDIDLPECSEPPRPSKSGSRPVSLSDIDGDSCSVDSSNKFTILNNNSNTTTTTDNNCLDIHHYEGREDEDDDDENDHYEIPVARQQLPSTDEASSGFGTPLKTPDRATGSMTSAPGSVEELFDSAAAAGAGADGVFESPPPPPLPPPLPPRREINNIRWSDCELPNSFSCSFDGGSGSGGGGGGIGRAGGGGGGDVPPELPFRPPQLPRRGELVLSSGALRSDKSEQSEKSDDRSDGEMSGDGGSTSYESFDEDHDPTDADPATKFNVRLPKKPKKKSTLMTKKSGVLGKKSQRALTKSRSSSHWEISVPFKQLETVDISGELYHRGKLSWNRRTVAISGGCLAMYKPDKDGARPSLVLQLTGYTAAVGEREGRRGYEVRLTHPSDDTHTFAVDFRDWANLWAEHINGTARGQPPPKYHTHLARAFSGGELSAPPQTGSKSTTAATKGLANTDTEPNEIEALFNAVEPDKDIGTTDGALSGTRWFGPGGSSKLHRGRTLMPKRFQPSKSPDPITRGRTLGGLPSLSSARAGGSVSPARTFRTGGQTVSSKDGHSKSIGAAVKDILARRQRGLFKVTQDAHGSSTGVSDVGSYSRKPTDIDVADWRATTGTVARGSFRLMPSSDRAKEAVHQQGRRPTLGKVETNTSLGRSKDGQQYDGVLDGDADGNGSNCGTSHGCGDEIPKGGASDEKSPTNPRVPQVPSSSFAPVNDGKGGGGSGGRVLTSRSPSRPLPVARWGWKSLFLAWSTPLDQILIALGASDLTASNSNLSTGSEETGDESSKPKLRGNKAVRMGSFAFRASQFFETIGKKTALKRKASAGSGSNNNNTAMGGSGSATISTTTNNISSSSGTARRQQLVTKTSSSSFGDLCNGIVEETSQVSSPTGSTWASLSVDTPTSDCSLPPVFPTPGGGGEEEEGEEGSSLGDHSASLSGTPSLDSPLAGLWSGRRRTKSGGSRGGDSFNLEEAESEGSDPFVGVSHKGYLYVFSSFSKRRWGRRWCVIRTNMFECYHQKKSLSGSWSGSGSAGQGRSQGEGLWGTCELNFLLRPCVLRRAVQETGSELGLMLVEEGKERITVEALSTEEIGPWVRALLEETSTPCVPEGLRAFVGEWEYVEADSGTVLQQWGLDNFVTCPSSHEYEDPQETTFTSNKVEDSLNRSTTESDTFAVDESTGGESALVLGVSLADEKAGSADVTLVCSSPVDERKKSATSDCQEASVTCQSFPPPAAGLAALSVAVCRTSPGSKNTDSGCYSGLGANSDSDSSCENSSSGRVRDAGDPDAGYATLDLSSKAARQTTKQPSSEEALTSPKDISSETDSHVACEEGDATSVLCDSSIDSSVSHAFSADVSPDSTCPVSSPGPQQQVSETTNSAGDNQTSMPSSCHHQSTSVLSPSMSSNDQSPDIPSRVPCVITSSADSSSSSTSSLSLLLKHKQTNSVTNTHTITSLCGEEYSLVLKRSDRQSLEVCQTSSRSRDNSTATLTPNHDSTSHSRSSSSTVESECSEAQSHPGDMLSNEEIPTHVTKSSDGEEDSVFQSIMVVGSDTATVRMVSEGQENATVRAEMEHVLSLSCNNNSESYYEPVGLAISERSQSKTERQDTDSLAAQVPDGCILTDTGSANLTHSSKLQQDISHDCVTSYLDSRFPSTSSSHLSTTEAVPTVRKSCSESGSTSPDPNSSTSSNAGHTELRVEIPSSSHSEALRPDSLDNSCTAPISPSTDLVSSLLDNPDTTPKDLEHAIGRLKDKKAQIRRKRMAVHDKRQRVSSDGERLVCEKEMAALEKLGEMTESDVRDLQNQLTQLEGESVKMNCGAATAAAVTPSQPQTRAQNPHRRNKSGSRRKKQKRTS